MVVLTGAGQLGMADEVAHITERLLLPKGAFITGADFRIDGGAAAAFFYGDAVLPF